MINATELRIGNYIQCDLGIRIVNAIWENGGIGVRVEIPRHEQTDSVHQHREIEPIQLNPGVIQRYLSATPAKHETGSTSYKVGRFNLVHLQSNEYLIYFTTQGKAFQLGEYSLSLHTFQNMYFSLVGEELNINP